MGTLKLKVKKAGSKNPVSKQLGFAARVLTNGTAEFDDIVKDAGRNTTMHKAELRMAFELCMDSVTEMLKQGYIVDLGPIGKIYPSCSSGWYEKEEDMKLDEVKPGLYFRAGNDVEGAIKSAKLVWAKPSDDDEEDDDEDGDDPTPTPSPTPGTVAAPTFSGATQFTETTQVTMSGPAGASIFYTVDGSTPTDQSLEYEEPITLSATTTVKAIAIKDGISSAVTSRTYSKVEGGGDDEPGGDDH